MGEAIIILLLCLIVITAAIIVLLVHVVNAVTDFKKEVRDKMDSISDYEEKLLFEGRQFKSNLYSSINETKEGINKLTNKIEKRHQFLSKAEKKAYKKLKNALDNTTS